MMDPEAAGSAAGAVAQRGRLDLTGELESNKRRLDSLARLLASKSICIALTIIDGKIYVAANELNETSKSSNRIIGSINSILTYFSTVTPNEDKEKNEEREIMKTICNVKRLPQKLPVTQGMSDEILNYVLNGDELTTSNVTLKKPDWDVPTTLFVYAKWLKLYRDFLKIRECLFNKQFPALTESLRSNRYAIYRKERNKDVHAEVQLLAQIVKLHTDRNIKNTKEFYFGISKLCCLGCRVMIDQANEVFRGIITFQTRGHHDLKFERWTPPNEFTKGYTDEQSKERNRSEKDFAYKIGLKTKEIILHLEKEKMKAASMDAEHSDSEAKITIEEMIEADKKRISNIKLFVESKNIDDKLEMALAICSLDDFIKLYYKNEDIKARRKIADTILKTLKEQSEKEIIDVDFYKLMEETSLWSNPIIQYFKGIKNDDMMDLEDKPAAAVKQHERSPNQASGGAAAQPILTSFKRRAPEESPATSLTISREGGKEQGAKSKSEEEKASKRQKKESM